MTIVWVYTLVSVFIVSLISLIGLTTLSIATEHLKKMLFVLIAFAAGALIGDVFFHLLPELVDGHGYSVFSAVSIVAGLLVFFVLEKFVHWRHCHMPDTGEHMHPFVVTNLVGDSIHNFIDGIIIAVSYLVAIPVGVATTVAVLFHEIPQEIGDFGVMLHGGFSKKKALVYNFLTALTAIVGAVVALALQGRVESADRFFLPFTVGAFIYIASADLIPELHKEVSVKKSALQLFAFVGGVAAMAALLYIE